MLKRIQPKFFMLFKVSDLSCESSTLNLKEKFEKSRRIIKIGKNGKNSRNL